MYESTFPTYTAAYASGVDRDPSTVGKRFRETEVNRNTLGVSRSREAMETRAVLPAKDATKQELRQLVEKDAFTRLTSQRLIYFTSQIKGYYRQSYS